ncbi:kinase-like protein [Hyaloscypha hepaticicola]|uniref:Kinase-like protein n=1 Tax=Hyaloscypha hepaticicola TaxID=2082293 RepID=A0A2J6PGX1_9HELO|nr:kinase-like protein [Hyaloscypha hepaticicola]
MDIASGLHALHQLGFTYRDLKLSNILVDSCPLNGIRAILTDFSGSIEHVPGMLAVDKGHYTPEWAAPEELTGCYNNTSNIYDYRLCDVYSFGTIVATLWIEEYIKPLSPIPCFLSSYCTETNGTTVEDQSKTLEMMKKRPDNAEDSPISVALAKLSVNNPSLVGDILRLTLCREPEERVQMDRVLLELGFPHANERVQHIQENQADIAHNSYTRFSRVLDELMRISELVKAVVKDKYPDLTLPKKLSDDESELWKIIQKINLEVQTKPLGREKNSLFATLAFDVSLCSLYGLGTSVNETQSLEWLLFSANLGNELAMGMTVPIAFSINENEEMKSWMRLHLGLSMLKGSHHSANYLTKLFPADCIALRRVVQKQSEGRDSTAENDRIKAQLDRWADHLDHLYNASTPSEPFDLNQGMSLYLGRCAAINGRFVPNDPHQPLGTDLAWTAKALYPPVLEARGTTISTTPRWISLYCFFLLFEQNTDKVVSVLDVLETLGPSDLTREMHATHTLNLLLKVYENPDMNVGYRLKLGENFKLRQIEMLQFLLNRGVDPFLSVATEDGPILCPFISGVMANNALATKLMLEHANNRGIDISEKLALRENPF